MPPKARSANPGLATRGFSLFLGMDKDDRYDICRIMYARGHIRTFDELFKYIPKTVVAKDLGINLALFNKKLLRPVDFTIGQIDRMAELYGIAAATLIKFAREASASRQDLPPGLPPAP